MDCPICLETIDINMYITPCHHEFHKSCYDKYIHFNRRKREITCPLCNTILEIHGDMIIIEIADQEVISPPLVRVRMPYYNICMFVFVITVMGNVLYFLTFALTRKH